MKNKKEIIIRIPKSIHRQMLDDLRRPHDYAFERVGFLVTRSVNIESDVTLIIGVSYLPVADENYIHDDSVGAKINSTAIRIAMQTSLDNKSGCFHVHLHDHSGKPGPSYTDEKDLPKVASSLANIAQHQTNGYLILSSDSAYASVLLPAEKVFYQASRFSVIGSPMLFELEAKRAKKTSKVYDRQSFLGPNSQYLFENITVGIVGYGGGGSHIGLQLAHVGVVNQVIFDDDKTEDTNLNRLVGAWSSDVMESSPKTSIADRTIKKVIPHANVILAGRWQQDAAKLQRCDIVVGCVDSYLERNQLEAQCRRYLIPYIDIGMDIHELEGKLSMSGQVILSMPDQPCMTCFGFLTEDKLKREAAKYGNVGGRPQVVWPNGVLASTAVGILIELITAWTQQHRSSAYLAYDGNLGTIEQHVRARFIKEECQHYQIKDAGPPFFKQL